MSNVATVAIWHGCFSGSAPSVAGVSSGPYTKNLKGTEKCLAAAVVARNSISFTVARSSSE